MNSEKIKTKTYNIFIKNINANLFQQASETDKNKLTASKIINNNNSNGNLFSNKQSKAFNYKLNIFGSSNQIEEEIEKIIEELEIPKRSNSQIDNKKLLYQTENDIFIIERLLKEHSLMYKNENKITFLDVVCCILKKNNKKFQEIEILKIYFLKIEKLVEMFKPLNISLNDMMRKLVSRIKYEKKLKDNILFKEGDKGDKFYIILKGEVGILIHRERIISCTPMEYLKALIFLYLYHEKSLVNKSILSNKDILVFDEKCFATLMDIFKYYYFYKEFLNITFYRDVIEFIKGEVKISKYLHKKNEFHPKECFQLLELSNLLAEELYKYYFRIIDNAHPIFWTKLENKNEITYNNNINNNPTYLAEFGLYIKFHENEEKNYKTETFFEKLNSINEISNNYICSCNVNDYLKRTNCDEIIKFIQKDLKNFYMNIYENKKNYKYYNYFEVNQLKDGNIFGELALINPSKKRTATIIIKEDCHLGVLNKEAYDSSIKNAQDKERIRNLLFFTNGPIFNGIANNLFLNNYFFRFKKRFYQSGEVIFHRGEVRKKIVFIINGELQLSAKITIKKLNEIINYLKVGKCLDDDLSKKYCGENFKFNKFYDNAKKTLKFYVLKDKEIAGLDNMTENNIYLFDCKCVSLEPTEAYELDIKIFEEALEDNLVKKNNYEYVQMKKEILVNRLRIQRDSLIKNEYYRIKTFSLNLNLDYIFKKENNNDSNQQFHLNQITFNKKLKNSKEDTQNTATSLNNFNTTINYFHKNIPSHILSPYEYLKNKIIQNKKINDVLKTENEEEKNLFHKKTFNKALLLNKFNKINKQNSSLLYQKNKYKNILKYNDINIIKNNERNKIRGFSSYINNKMQKIKDRNFSSNKKTSKDMPQKILSPLLINRNKKIQTPSKILVREYKKKYIEPNKTPSHKRRFVFNNQTIFESLLNYKDIHEKKYIDLTQIKDNFPPKKTENFKQKTNFIFDNEIENSEPSRIKQNNFLQNKYRMANNYKDKRMEENYKDIFFIDCLCLDQWEEKTNRNTEKEISKLKGKKIKSKKLLIK